MVKMWDAKNAGWKEVMNRTFEECLKEMECGGILLVLKEDFIVEIRLDIREDEVYTMQAFHTVEISEYPAADSVELVPVLRGCECTVGNDLAVLNRFSDLAGRNSMEIKITLSTSDLERIKDTLGITDYDDIHTAMVQAFDQMLEKKENSTMKKQ